MLELELSELRKGLDLGTFKGVYIPSILTILGVILYMRMGWVVGNAGFWGSLAIVTMASAITFITGLSISSTATNMDVKAGGIYFMVSRSFGIEAGTAIGLPLYLAQALGISFYIAGFSESIVQILPWVPELPLSLFSLVVISALAYYSPSLALRAQIMIFIVIVLSLIAFFLGGSVREGVGVLPSTSSESFWKVFAVFFPAVTGIGAGVSMSGDLRKPHRSLPLGTMAAILTGYVVYMAFAILFYKYATVEQLKTDPKVIFAIAAFPPAIYLGIWFATLSSALGSILGAPRTLQAMAQDKILPESVGKGYGETNDPRVATVLTFIIAGAGLSMGGLDAIAPVLSMFFLTAYGALNLIAGFEGMLSNPSWRPTFKTPWALSLLGAFACFGVMFMINPGASFLAFFFCLAVYMIMKKRSLNSNWSDIRRGLMSYAARSSIYGLEEYEEDARSWRPNVLVITDSPMERWFLSQLGGDLCHGKSLLCVSAVLPRQSSGAERLYGIESSVKNFLQQNRVSALVKVKESDDFFSGAEGLISDYGLGALSPNTIICEWSSLLSNSSEKLHSLVSRSQNLGKNLLFVKEGLSREVEKKRRRRGPQRIDIWWDFDLQNSSFMLALAYMLQVSPSYMRSYLSIKCLVSHQEEVLSIESQLQEFFRSSRIEAHPEILMKKDRGEMSLLRDLRSKKAQKMDGETDLSFVGLRAPRVGESAEDYASYVRSVVEERGSSPLCVFTIAGEKNINFKKIFEN